MTAVRCILPLILTAIAFLHCDTAFALQDGEIDPEFGSEAGFRRLDSRAVGGVPSNDRGLFAHRLADGRLLLAAQAQQTNAQRVVVYAVSANGIDISAFAEFPQEFKAIDGVAPAARGFGVDASERLLIGGTVADPVDGSNDPVVVRALPPDYAPDPNYGDSGEAHPFAFVGDTTLLALAVAGDGSAVACGQIDVGAGVRQGYCVRLDADGALDPNFGIGGRWTYSVGGVIASEVRAVRFDAQGHLLVAGNAAFDVSGNTHTFLARLDASGAFDQSFCADNCTDGFVHQTEPGYRIDTGPTTPRCLDLALRGDGHIGVGQFPGNFLGPVAYFRYREDGRLAGIASEFRGDGALGCGDLELQPDFKPVLAFTYRFAGVQYGAVLRLQVEPTLVDFYDPSFSGSAVALRAPLPGARLAEGNECNQVLVEADGILCSGLARESDSPLNLDHTLVRLRNGVPMAVFADGFEDDPP